MPNPVWPSALCPAGLEWRLVKAGAQFRSPFTRSLQAIDFIGESWEINVALHGEGREQINSGLLDAQMMHLAGGVNQIDIYHWRRPVPRGTMRGSPTMQVATARGDTQLVLTVLAGSTLEPGDLIGAGIVGAGFQIFMVRAACAAVGTTLTVPVVNRARGLILSNTAVIWDKPLLPVVMPEMSAGLSYRPGQTLPAEFQLVEFPTINTTFLSSRSPGTANIVFTGLAPTSITPWTPVFDSALGSWFDSRDLPNGAVASWASRDAVANTVTQGTGAAQPTKGATGVVFDGGDTVGRSNPPALLISATTLPSASNSTAGKGFTCTGLAQAPDGTWWVGNHGLALTTDTVYAASLVHLSSDAATVIGEILLVPLYAGIESVQGVVYDKSDGTLWFSDLANVKIRHITTAGVPITTDEITPSWIPNGLARDHANDRLWISQLPAGNSIECRSCVDGTVVFSAVSSATSNIDHLYFDDATNTLLLSWGANGVAGSINVYSAVGALKLLGVMTMPATSNAIEGIVWSGNKLFVANDGWYHNAALNQLLNYTIEPLTSNVIDIWGVVTIPTTTGVDAVIVLGDPISSATIGWGIYTGSNTSLQVYAESGGTGTTTRASYLGTVPSLTTPRIFYARIDQTNNLLSLWVDGTVIGTADASVLVGPSPNVGTLRIGQDPSGREPTMTIGAIGYGMGQCDREKTEGYLAHTFALSANLPSGHPYKSAPP